MYNKEAMVRKLLNVAQELHTTGRTSASTGERIAAAFILNNMQYLPEGYTVLEAWERIDDLQRLTLAIHKYYGHQFQ